MARDMPEPCEFPSQDSCPKRFLWAHKAVGLVLQVGEALGLVLQVGEALGLESLDRFLRVFKQGPRLTAAAEDGSDSNRDLYSLNLHAKLMVLLSPDPF